MFDVEKIRVDFPIFASINEKFVYLDSAATSQKPIQVIDAVSDFYRSKNSNVARGLYPIAEEATAEYENVRETVKKFIGAKNDKEIIFTKNTTEGSNIVMRGWGEKFVKKGDKIVTTVIEHHSNFVPWQELARRTGASFEVVDIDENGELDLVDFEKKVKNARLFAVSAASNVIGTMPEIRKLADIVHDEGGICVVDGAQSVPSTPTDVKKMDCDFLTFSGHKMLAPFGVGVLYGKEEILERTDPLIYGSEMIRSVTIEKTELNEVPYKFESGTPDVPSVIGLRPAIDYLKKTKLENIKKHENELIGYMFDRLGEINGLDILGPEDIRKRVALVAFTLEGVHPHDVSAMLAEDGICVRSGHHCAMPIHERLSIPASTRASVYLYNKKEEIDALAESLIKIKKIFG